MKVEAEYIYRNIDGTPYEKVKRFEEKEGFPVSHYINGKWESGKAKKALPYNLDKWHNQQRNLFSVEGEKDSDNLVKLGFHATTNRGGAGNTQDETIPYFKGKTLYILNDNDPKGFYHRYDRIKKLYGIADKIYFLDLPELSEKGDVSDWIESQRKAGLSDPEIAETLKELCKGATLVTDKVMAEIVEPEYVRYKALCYPGQQEPSQEQKKETFPDPEDILRAQKLFSVLTYSDDLLPNVFSKAVSDISERMQAPAEFIAVSYLIAASSVLAYKINIQPKKYDSRWTVCCNLWGALIGSPSVMKSPALSEALAPLKALDKGAETIYLKEKEDYCYDIQAVEAFKAAATSKVSAFMKSGKLDNQTYQSDDSKRLEAKKIFQKLQEMKDSIPEPQRRRYIVQDCTIEKLQVIQSENAGHGILVKRDELTGFFRKLDSQGHEQDRTYYLESWAGDSDYDNGTITRGDTKVENNTLALIGTIQPSMIRLLLAGTISGNHDDGLFQRLQLAVYPDIKDWQRIDRQPNFNALEAVFQVFKDIAEIDPEQCAFFKMNKSYESQPDRWYLKFDDEAQELFNSWWENWEHWIRAESLPEYLVSHFTKYRKLIPSLVLILYLLSGSRNCYVDKISLQRAIKWAELLKSHAFRIYGQVLNISETTARLIAERLIKKELESEFTLRELKQKGWSGINEDTAEKGLESLQEAGWGSLLKIDTQGRPSTIFRVNPLVFQKYPKWQPSKPSKAHFEPFEGSLSNDIPENKPEESENLFDTSFVDEVIQ